MSLAVDKGTSKRIAFGDVVSNINVTVKDPADANIDRTIAMEHLDSGKLTIERWGDIADGATFTRRVRPGQTLFGKRRAYQRKAAYATFDAVCSGDILVLEADETQILREFLPILVQSDGFFNHALGTSAGSLSPRTNWRDLSDYEFDLPPLDEQRRIADLLWSMERHQRAVAALIRTSRAIEGVWLDRVVAVHAAAQRSTVGDLVRQGRMQVLTGPFGSALSAREYVEGGIPVIHPSFIVEGELTVDPASTVSPSVAERLARWKVQPGDIVLNRKRDVGRSAIVSDREAGWILGSDCILLRVADDSLDARFVQLMLQAPSAKRELLKRAPGTAMPGINEKSLTPLLVPSLSLMEQQKVQDQHLRLAQSAWSWRQELSRLGDLNHALMTWILG